MSVVSCHQGVALVIDFIEFLARCRVVMLQITMSIDRNQDIFCNSRSANWPPSFRCYQKLKLTSHKSLALRLRPCPSWGWNWACLWKHWKSWWFHHRNPRQCTCHCNRNAQRRLGSLCLLVLPYVWSSHYLSLNPLYCKIIVKMFCSIINLLESFWDRSLIVCKNIGEIHFYMRTS